MEQSYSWDNWLLDVEVGDDIDKEEEFLRDILQQQQPALSCESESRSKSHRFLNNNDNRSGGSSSLSSSNEMNDCDDKSGKTYTKPRRYIIAFDKSTIIPATTVQPQPPQQQQQQSSSKPTNINNSPLASKKGSQGGKKTRSDSQTVDHIMAERRRRQELTQKFIALSSTIPGLKKTDKTSILGEAISYMKQLQERVKELEEGSKRSALILKKINLCANGDPTLSETNSEECCELLPYVKAKVLEMEVMVDIICEKENGIELKILDLLQRLHLFVTGSSVLPFGNSTLGVTIIAKMGDAYNMNVNDLVKTIRQVLLNKMTN